jgi:hypothetical protein
LILLDLAKLVQVVDFVGFGPARPSCSALRSVAQVIPDTKTNALRPIVLDTVVKGATISTDESNSYDLLKRDG